MNSSLDKLRAAMETASPADGGNKKSFSLQQIIYYNFK